MDLGSHMAVVHASIAVVVSVFIWIALRSKGSPEEDERQIPVEKYTAALGPLVQFVKGPYSALDDCIVRNPTGGQQVSEKEGIIFISVWSLIRSLALPGDQIRITDTDLLKVFAYEIRIPSLQHLSSQEIWDVMMQHYDSDLEDCVVLLRGLLEVDLEEGSDYSRFTANSDTLSQAIQNMPRFCVRQT